MSGRIDLVDKDGTGFSYNPSFDNFNFLEFCFYNLLV